MKIGIIGTGAVGAACTLATIMRGCAREIVLLDKVQSRAKAVATDMRYGLPVDRRIPLTPSCQIELTP
jgi:L-lactate dehydrogenase